MSANLKIFQPTLLPPPVYLGEVSLHMHDSGESNDMSVCHTTNKTCPSICQPHQPSVCHSVKMTCLSICQSCQTSVSHTINHMICLLLHQSMHNLYHPSINHTFLPSISMVHVITPVHASSMEHVHTSCITSVVAPAIALPILSIH